MNDFFCSPKSLTEFFFFQLKKPKTISLDMGSCSGDKKRRTEIEIVLIKHSCGDD
jgi:hypothetical protein